MKVGSKGSEHRGPSLRRALSGAVIAVAVAGTAVGAAAPAQAAPAQPAEHSTVRHETHHDTSIPLAQMRPAPYNDKARDVLPLLPVPSQPGTALQDPAVQSSFGTAATLSLGIGFDGIGQGFTGPAGTYTVTSAPPDTNAAVGATQIMEIVNTAIAVFSKSGSVLYGPVPTNTLFSGFGGACQNTNDGDGIVRYDALANRWVVTQFANARTSGPFFECVAVSTTSDATGTWHRYAFQFSTFPDYPKLSVWPDAYYITYNRFNASKTSYVGPQVCAMHRAAMLAGTTATQQCFTPSSSYSSLLGADFEGGLAPPVGAANTVVALGTTFFGGLSFSIVYWKFHVDWTTPSNTTLTGPTSITVAAYSRACARACVPQAGTSQQLDALGDRAMFRAAYRNLGSHEALVFNHSVALDSGIGVRWYELRNVSGTPNLFQQGTYAPDSTRRWMGSIAMDRIGNIALGYSASSGAIHPQIRITGRLASDPAGTMTQAETTVVAGAGSQTGGLSRWGDYSSMVVDPVDGCTFWYAQEYIPANGSFNWRTHLRSFTLPYCLPRTCTVNLTAGTHNCTGLDGFGVQSLSSGRLLLKLTLAPRQTARFGVTYNAAPSGFTVNIGDSATNDGGGGDGFTQSNDAEMMLQNQVMSVFGRDGTPTYPLATVSNAGISAGEVANFEVTDRRFCWNFGAFSCVNSEWLYALNGQPDSEGPVNYDIYAAFNRVITGRSDRNGTGVSLVSVTVS